MVEIRNGKKVLITPVSAEDLEDIKVGDIVYLDGSMTTCRDVAHRRLVEEGRELPVDVRNNAIFHAGPIIRPLENDKFEMVSVVAATEVEEIVRAEWRDLGMPETLWNCRVKEFGPLIVSIDTKGNNMFEENKVIFNQKKDAAYEKISKEVGFIK